MSSKPSIRLLETVTINQIAAGEVIENAISVVKELVENSLDSGADEIEVETLGGGQGLIVVKDNGCGMSAEDVQLALQRHATSKIGNFSDIFSLSSFGFRGEALPAIASVSKMEIVTCFAPGEGSRTVIHGGEIVSQIAQPRQKGTTITIDSLFYNVPVRKGFQKSPQSDRVAMRKLLENRVLSMEGVGWSWISERNEEISVTKKQTFAERVALVMGEEFMQEALLVDRECDSTRVKGFIGAPGFHRPSRVGQRIFINDRPVDSWFISKIVSEAYSMLLPPQRYPVFILKLYLPPSWCDFNVHPQKIEVRILKEEIVRQFLSETIVSVLSRCHQYPPIETPQVPTVDVVPFFDVPLPPQQEPHHFNAEQSAPEPYIPSFLSEVFVMPPVNTKKEICPPPVSPVMEEEQTQFIWDEVRLLASLGKVVLAQDSEGVHAIFIEAARKHLFYLSLIDHQQEYMSQVFLIPIKLSVTPAEGMFLASCIEDFAKIGIEIAQIGPCVFSIESAPTFIEAEELQTWILSLMVENRKIDKQVSEMFIKESLAKMVFSKTSKRFDQSWLTLLWRVGKPEHAFDGARIRHLVVDEDFIKE